MLALFLLIPIKLIIMSFGDLCEAENLVETIKSSLKSQNDLRMERMEKMEKLMQELFGKESAKLDTNSRKLDQLYDEFKELKANFESSLSQNPRLDMHSTKLDKLLNEFKELKRKIGINQIKESTRELKSINGTIFFMYVRGIYNIFKGNILFKN